jgi:hypothetical protein
MGWTTTHRAKGISNDAWFQQEVVGEGRTILASSTIKTIYYAAVRDDDTGEVWALVCLTQRMPRSHFNYGWKSMSDTMGPGAAQAPAKVLDALTETTNEYALAWRAECRKNLAFKASQPVLQPGDRVQFARAMTFNFQLKLVSVDTFVYEGSIPGSRNVFRTVGDGDFRVRIPNWRALAFTVVTEATV